MLVDFETGIKQHLTSLMLKKGFASGSFAVLYTTWEGFIVVCDPPGKKNAHTIESIEWGVEKILTPETQDLLRGVSLRFVSVQDALADGLVMRLKEA